MGSEMCIRDRERGREREREERNRKREERGRERERFKNLMVQWLLSRECGQRRGVLRLYFFWIVCRL